MVVVSATAEATYMYHLYRRLSPDEPSNQLRPSLAHHFAYPQLSKF